MVLIKVKRDIDKFRAERILDDYSYSLMPRVDEYHYGKWEVQDEELGAEIVNLLKDSSIEVEVIK